MPNTRNDAAPPSAGRGVALLPLKNRSGRIVAWAEIDPEDHERLSQHRWHLKGAGKYGDCYVGRQIRHPEGGRNKHGKPRQTTLSLQRAVMGLKWGDPQKVDHLDGDTLNNRKANLRICTHAENLQNRKKRRKGRFTSAHRGVSWRKDRRRWQAYGCVNGRQFNLGFYVDESAAATAAANFRAEHMPFATD
jgi:hypothetical protein